MGHPLIRRISVSSIPINQNGIFRLFGLSSPLSSLLKLLLPIILVLVNGCVSYTLNKAEIEQFLVAQQPGLALEQLESKKVNRRNRAVYLLDKGMLQRMQGDLVGSNKSLEEAKQLSEQLSAVSFREQSTAMSVNDAMRSYLPPLFERVLIYCFKAINYLELQQGDAARVEILQLDELLKQNDDFYFPFARYVSGLVFDFNNEPDNALIAYRKAYEAYLERLKPVPMLLKQDLLRLTDYLGLSDEHQKYRGTFKLAAWPSQADVRNNGTVVAMVFNGLIPRKHSQEINSQSFNDGQLYRIAVPYYEKRIAPVRNAQLKVVGSPLNARVPSGNFVQLGEHAEAALTKEMPKIMGRAVARVAVKNTTVNKAADENPLLGIVLNIATFVSEQADIRGWYTLPQEILISRIVLEPGADQTLELALQGSSNPGARKNWKNIHSQKGQMQVLSWYWSESIVTHRMP